MKYLTLILGLMVLPGTLLADEIESKLTACRMIEDPTERLQCYDKIVEGESESGNIVTTDEETIINIAGEDDFDSQVFTAEEEWHLRWTSQGSIMTIELRDFTGELIGIVGNQIGRGEGRSETLDPGEYMLAVRSIGEWEIFAIRGE
ncbi:hypothetical protein [Fodinicurvata sediminis]|uniref:hypothetical protein n=1 Tax=Fodinicurvata sediminis TaxID=1121832 RepID=UPI0003B3892D|nr:hypothetical protein [Fodinicurvata sediminis]